MADTIFGKITRGEIPTEFLYEDEHCVVIRDIQPQAPTHVLIIPRKPIARLVDSQPEDQTLLGHLLIVAGKVADQLGVGDAFRLVINNGEGAVRPFSICTYIFLPAATWPKVNSPRV